MRLFEKKQAEKYIYNDCGDKIRVYLVVTEPTASLLMSDP